MKGNYKLYSLRLAKTGVVFGVNKFGHKWLELWWKGKFSVVDAAKIKRIIKEEYYFLKTGKDPVIRVQNYSGK